MPDDVDVVLVGRRRAVVDPDLLLVGVRLRAGGRSVVGPGPPLVRRLVHPDHQDGARAVDPHRRRPRGAVGGPVDGRVGVEGVPAVAGKGRLAPGRPAVQRVELGLEAAAADVVRGPDDPARVPVVHADVGLAAGGRLGAGDPVVRPDGGGEGGDREALAGPLPFPDAFGGILVARREVGLGEAGAEVLVGLHPLDDFLQDERVAARRVRGAVVALGVRLAPDDLHPRRDLPVVVPLVLAKDREVLVLADEPLEGRSGASPRLPELCFERRLRVRVPRRQRRRGTGQKQTGDDDGRGPGPAPVRHEISPH